MEASSIQEKLSRDHEQQKGSDDADENFADEIAVDSEAVQEKERKQIQEEHIGLTDNQSNEEIIDGREEDADDFYVP